MSPERNEAQSESVTGTVPNRGGHGLYAPTAAEQRTARIMGAWFLGTFVFSIPAYFFYNPILNHANYVVGSGDDTRVAVGALLEILLAISGIATAVVIFPIVKRVNESVALGYIGSRTVESILILVGVVSLMSIVGLRQDHADAANTSGPLIEVASLTRTARQSWLCQRPSAADAVRRRLSHARSTGQSPYSNQSAAATPQSRRPPRSLRPIEPGPLYPAAHRGDGYARGRPITGSTQLQPSAAVAARPTRTA
jgi:hypothetical protein